jgi:hypothetical protein
MRDFTFTLLCFRENFTHDHKWTKKKYPGGGGCAADAFEEEEHVVVVVTTAAAAAAASSPLTSLAWPALLR